MRTIMNLFRLIHINFVLVRHGFDEVVLSIPWFYPIRFLAYFNPWNWFYNKGKSRGERIRLMLEELGPIFVKFGQLLSTRRDFLPDEIADELARLQDKVPPFSIELVKKIIIRMYGKKVEDLFPEFDETPLASASIAQVHCAFLEDGQDVVIKVRRPGIRKIIRRDLDLMYTFARLVEHYWSEGHRLRPVEVVREFERTLMDELDFIREAANASQLRRNFENSPLLYIPEIHWEFASEEVIVMERIDGVHIADVTTLKKHHVNFKALAERGVEIFFTQVFRDCFFHADMHPGNIFVDVSNPDDPRYLAVDFGIMGSLSPSDQRYLAENFLAFFKRDYFKVAVLHVESGWVPPDTRVDEFEAAIRTVCEPVFQRPLKEISFGRLLMKLFQTAKRFDMKVQPQLLLLQKTLLSVEGLGRQLYPDLDLWSTAKPFLENWLKTQVGPKAFFDKIKQNVPYWLEKMPELPDLFYRFLRENEYQQRVSITQEKVPQRENKKQHKRFAFGIGVALLAIVGIEYWILPMTEQSVNTYFWFLGGTAFIGFFALIYSMII